PPACDVQDATLSNGGAGRIRVGQTALPYDADISFIPGRRRFPAGVHDAAVLPGRRAEPLRHMMRGRCGPQDRPGGEVIRRAGPNLRGQIRMVPDEQRCFIPEVRRALESKAPDRLTGHRIDGLVMAVAARVMLRDARLYEKPALTPHERHAKHESFDCP